MGKQPGLGVLWIQIESIKMLRSCNTKRIKIYNLKKKILLRWSKKVCKQSSFCWINHGCSIFWRHNISIVYNNTIRFKNCNVSEIYVIVYMALCIPADEVKLWSGSVGIIVVR